MMDVFYYADLTRLAAWVGIIAGTGLIATVGMVALVIMYVGLQPAGLASMALAYIRRHHKGLADEDNVGLDIFRQ